MKGVIIFADDDIYKEDSNEKKLCLRFLNAGDPELVVIPVSTLEQLENILESVTNIKCIILDWTWVDAQNEELNAEINDGFTLPERHPDHILKKYNPYSLIYIYSREEGINLQDFGLLGESNKIKIRHKNVNINIEEEYGIILNDMHTFEQENPQMVIPRLWSSTINKKTHSIFSQLESLSPKWINLIMKTAEKDNIDTITEVINIFQNLLFQNLILDSELRKAISEYSCINNKENKDPEIENILEILRVYRQIIYLEINKEAPLGTGDIFKFDNDEYAILITPECDIKKASIHYLLKVEEEVFKAPTMPTKKDKEVDNWVHIHNTKVQNKWNQYVSYFNNSKPSEHYLPSFPFTDDLNNIGFIDFKTNLISKTKEELSTDNRSYRLMSPYIHQLRQRFIASLGRHGVPALPVKLKEAHIMWDMKKFILDEKND